MKILDRKDKFKLKLFYNILKNEKNPIININSKMIYYEFKRNTNTNRKKGFIIT